MTDYTEQGAVPVDDAVAPDPPTIDDALAERDARARQRHDGGGVSDDDDTGDPLQR